MITKRQRTALRRAAETASAQDHRAFDRLAHPCAIVDLLDMVERLEEVERQFRRCRDYLARFVGDRRAFRIGKGEGE
jgi:hypothetical protein